jgi:anti-anti-sigma factor
MTQSRYSHFDVQDAGEVSVVRFTAKRLLDINDIQVMGMEMYRLVDGLGRRNLILDLANVDYLSSSALGKFITLYKKVKAVGGRLVIRHLNAQIRELFKLSDLPWEAGDGPESIPADKQSSWDPPLAADWKR